MSACRLESRGLTGPYDCLRHRPFPTTGMLGNLANIFAPRNRLDQLANCLELLRAVQSEDITSLVKLIQARLEMEADERCGRERPVARFRCTTFRCFGLPLDCHTLPAHLAPHGQVRVMIGETDAAQELLQQHRPALEARVELGTVLGILDQYLERSKDQRAQMTQPRRRSENGNMRYRVGDVVASLARRSLRPVWIE